MTTQEIKHDHSKPARTIKSGSEYMNLYPCGCIGRASWGPSEKWRIVGAHEYNNFGRCVRFYTLAEILENPGVIPWQYKNGKQRTYLADIDHGTRRGWGSPNHCVF